MKKTLTVTAVTEVLFFLCVVLFWHIKHMFAIQVQQK